jgi:hypothetical protein
MAYQTCSACSGSGRTNCTSCSGGTVGCNTCGWSGRRWLNTGVWGEGHYESCSSCGGSGRQRCVNCGGLGTISCPNCGGEGRRYVADPSPPWPQPVSTRGGYAAPIPYVPPRRAVHGRHETRSRAGWKLKLFTAFLGSFVCAVVVAAKLSVATPPAWTWLAGAIAGWFLPAILILLRELLGVLFRVMLFLIRIALVLALIGGVIYCIVRFIGH